MNQLPEPFEPLPTSPPRRIVCAAIKHLWTGQVIIGVRHSCPIMRSNISARGGSAEWKHSSEQGFVDQYGKFHTREEAWVIAEGQGQIRQVTGTAGTLYSEDLY